MIILCILVLRVYVGNLSGTVAVSRHFEASETNKMNSILLSELKAESAVMGMPLFPPG
jgi:hypothetical protein